MSVYQTDILTDREADIIIVIKFYFIWTRNIPSDTNAEGISKYKLMIKNHIARQAFRQIDRQRTCRQTDRQTGRQIKRQTGRQRGRQIYMSLGVRSPECMQSK